MGVRRKLAVIFFAFLAFSCGNDKKKEVRNTPKKSKEVILVNAPEFNQDSAYAYLAQQVEFGPRIPNTRPHVDCGDYLIEKLGSLGATVQEQPFNATAFDGNNLYLRNIIGSYNPQAKKRILLAAHWDTRPFSDKDKDKPNDPFDGANDGASGVAVLLEIARQIEASNLKNIGLDIIFFDGEDYGEKQGRSVNKPLEDGWDSWWCLGSQYWSKNKHKTNYGAYYGVLLDMVGGKNATFYKEGHSIKNAPSVVDKVWNTGRNLGYGSYFVESTIGEITDDHEFVIKIGKIPMINIIDYKPDTFFFKHHHTQKDDIEYISKETLKAVGQTVLQILYQEDAAS